MTYTGEVIDERVVKLEFDNEEFEKNIGDSMESLSKFEQILLNIGGNLAGRSAGEFFGNLGSAIGNSALNTSISAISSGVEEVKIQFDALGIIGKRVLEDLTDSAISLAKNGIAYLFNGIKNGGLSRALNIEDAKFRLKGLEIEWNKIADDINYGVQDTAYGLDQAAVAASMLAASGVKFGGSYKEGAEEISEMGSTLRAISGVAAMTGQDFQHVGHIFTTVASNGKLMTRQIRQFAFSGMNVSSALVKYFNAVNKGEKEATEQTKESIKEITGGLQITEEALNDMVTKGKVDFKTFAEAMDSTFGSHAKEANTTFKGAMSNIRAAMSRVGATFFSPLLEQNGALVKLLNIFRLKIDEIKATVIPFAEVITERINNIIKLFSIFVEKLNFKKVLDVGVVKNIIDSVLITLIGLFGQLYNILEPIKRAFNDVFPYDFIGLGKQIIIMLFEMMSAFTVSEDAINDVYTISYAFFNLLKIGLKILIQIGIALSPVIVYIGNLVRALGNGIVLLSGWVSGLKMTEKVAKSVAKPFFVFEKIGQIINSVTETISKLFSSTKKTGNLVDKKQITESVSLFEQFLNILNKVSSSFEEIRNASKPVSDALSNIFNSNFVQTLMMIIGLFLTVSSSLNFIKKTAIEIEKKGVSGIFSDLFDVTGITKVTNSFARVMNSASGAIDTFTKSIQIGNLKKIAICIAILAASLIALSLIPSNKIAGSLLMLGSCFLFLSLMFKSLANTITAENIDNIVKAVPVLISISVAIAVLSGSLGILSVALKLLTLADPEEALEALLIMIGLLASIVGAIYVLVLEASNIKYAETTILSIALMILVFGYVLTILSTVSTLISFIPWQQLISGFSFVTLTLIGISVAVAALSKLEYKDPTSIVGIVVSLVAITASLTILGGVLTILSHVPWQQLAATLGIVVAALVGMSAIIWILSKLQNAKDVVQGTIAMIKISFALAAFGNALRILEKVDISKAAGGLIAFVVVIGLFIAASKALSKAAEAGAEAIAVIAIVGIALGIYAAQFIAFAVGVDIFVHAGYKLLEMLKFMSTFSTTEIANIAKNFLAITGILDIMVAGIAYTVVKAREYLIKIASTIVDIIVNTLILVAPLLATGVKVLFVSIVDAILGSVPTLISAIFTAYAQIINAINDNMEPIVQAAVSLITNFVEIFKQYIPVLADSGAQMAIALWDGMKTAFVTVLQSSDIGTIFLNILYAVQAVAKGVLVAISAIVTAISTFILIASSTTQFVWNNLNAMQTMIFTVFANIVNAFNMFGQQIMQGLLQGLSGSSQMVLSFVANFANNILNIFRTIFGIHSPSEVLHKFGVYLGEGLEGGLDSMYNRVVGSAKRLGAGIKEGVADGSSETNVFLDGLSSGFNGFFSGVANGAWNASMAVDMFFAKFQGYSTAVGALNKLETQLKNKNSKATYGGGGTAYIQMAKGIKNAYNSGAKTTNPLTSTFSTLSDLIDKNTEGLGDFSTAAGGAGKAAGGASKGVESLADSFKSMEEMQSSLQEKIKGSIDIFSEFSRESDLSADKLLANMRSQVEGVKEWSNNLQTLAGRGIERGLLQKLTELGPQGWDKVQAFVNMTDDQLREANGLYAESLMLPQTESEKITQSFAQAGMWASDGFVNGIYTNAGYQPGMLMGQSALNGLIYALDAHSPSEATKEIGGYATEGFEDGLEPGITRVYGIGINMGRMLVKGLNSALGKAMMTSIGRSVVVSFANAFTKATVVTTAVKTFCDNIKITMAKGLLDVGYIEMAYTMMTNIITGYQNGMKEFLAEIDLQNKTLSDKMLETFTEIGEYAGEGLRKGIENKIQEVADETIKLCDKVVKAAKKTFDENSPSRVFEEIGLFLGTGLANGIKNSSSKAVGATTTMADSTVNSFKSAIAKVQDYIQNGMDDSLTITPVMDLSNVDAGLSRMNSLMGSKKFNLSGTLENASKVAAAFGGTGSGVNAAQAGVVNNTYTFNQTNNSPKALSNAEIYRQTNNLINRYRNDIGYA